MRCSALAVAVLLVPVLSCGGGEDAKPAEPRTVPLVEAVPARAGAIPLSERVTGTVKARNQVEIRAEVEAPIVEVFARGGEAVRKGQPLVRHRDVELREQLRRAEADVEVAEAAAREESARVAELDAQVRRTRALARDQLVSEVELETLTARLNAARAAADAARARITQARAVAAERRSALGRSIVRAPVDGWIGLRNAEVGMLPGANTLLFVIGDLQHVIVDIPLTQELSGTVRAGAPVAVDPGGGAAPIRGTVTRVSPFLAAGSRSTIAEIELPNPGRRLRPGMSVKVDVIHGESSQTTLVPLSALYEDPRTGSLSVYVVPGMTAGAAQEQPRNVARRTVSVIARGAGAAGITAVQAGEWVVSNGQHLLARDDVRTARVRPATWERILQLQGLQREDLLAEFLTRQQEHARAGGAEPPATERFLAGTGR